jgi:ATP-dependent helicase/nuclease subunit A
MILVGTLRDVPRTVTAWAGTQNREELLLADHLLARGRSYLDWVGPALIRHPAAAILRKLAGIEGTGSTVLHSDSSNWSISVTNAAALSSGSPFDTEDDAAKNEEKQRVLEALRKGKAVTAYSTAAAGEIADRLEWQYPLAAASSIPAKTSVTELKSMLSLQEQPSFDLLEERAEAGGRKERPGTAPASRADSLHLRRPKFMEKRGLTGAERGTAYHTVMQHAVLEATLARLARVAILSGEQAEAVELDEVEAFYRSELGRRLLDAKWKQREQPFSYMVPAGEAYEGLDYYEQAADSGMTGSGALAEAVLIQGVIDCLFRENGRLILVDYKTDAVLEHTGGLEGLREKYRFQLELYSKALQDITGETVSEIWLYFFDGGHAVSL